ncbi:unnamed protein product [Arabis nemorensis]|uniref:Uncharacterized protein n=1 Tax=Arabis nemorensis TaxID=586526 RepID=A0A565BR55_9BRAS|nr:unnamed protein product [Arabis nemorensis]
MYHNNVVCGSVEDIKKSLANRPSQSLLAKVKTMSWILYQIVSDAINLYDFERIQSDCREVTSRSGESTKHSKNAS